MTSHNTPRPVLITGAAGFIGSHLTDNLLSDGIPVVGVDNFDPYYDPAIKHQNIADAKHNPLFTLISADIGHAQAVADIFKQHRPQAVIHLAALAGVRPSLTQASRYAQVNIQGTINLLDSAVATGTQKFLFTSSSSVYGNQRKVPFVESDPTCQPISPYAMTKQAGELICHTYAHLHKLPVFCLRLFTVFGPRQRPDLAIARFMSACQNGLPIDMFGDGSSSRDYTYVDDIVAGYRAALDCCDRFDVFNLGGDHPVSLKTLIKMIQQVTSKTLTVNPKPMQTGDVNQTWADVTKARYQLDYQVKTTLKAGLVKQWQWLEHVAAHSVAGQISAATDGQRPWPQRQTG